MLRNALSAVCLTYTRVIARATRVRRACVAGARPQRMRYTRVARAQARENKERNCISALDEIGRAIDS